MLDGRPQLGAILRLSRACAKSIPSRTLAVILVASNLLD
jgi:hypothetical protein